METAIYRKLLLLTVARATSKVLLNIAVLIVLDCVCFAGVFVTCVVMDFIVVVNVVVKTVVGVVVNIVYTVVVESGIVVVVVVAQV